MFCVCIKEVHGILTYNKILGLGIRFITVKFEVENLSIKQMQWT